MAVVRRAGGRAGRVIVLAVAVLAALAAVYARVLSDLAGAWLAVPYYSYGVPVAPFSGYLVWESRAALRGGPAPRAREGLALVGLGLAVLAAGLGGGSLALQTLSLPVVVGGLCLYALGRERARALAFPLAFLVFMTPVPGDAIEWLSPPLQLLAAWATEQVLLALDVPVARDGLFLYLRTVTLHVTEACNGLRFLFAMIVLGAAFAWATQRRLRARALVVLLAVAAAVLANIVRVATTALLAHGWGAEAATGFFHLAYGKVVYAALLGLFVLGAVRCRWRE